MKVITMFKNVKVKRLLKGTIFPLFTLVNKMIPKSETRILLYSANGGIRHNLKPVLEYLLENGYDSKYEIICGIEKLKFADDNVNVTYVNRFRSILCFLRSKYVFYTTGQIPIKPAKSQMVVHLDHGAAGFKAFGLLSNIHNGDEFFFTYYMAPSELYVAVAERAFGCSRNHILINDEPVIDTLLNNRSRYELGDYKLVGIWMPTFRQSYGLGYDDSCEKNLLPLIGEEFYEEFNRILQKHKIKIIAKIHSGQDLERFRYLKLSNLEIVSEEEMRKNGWELYPLLSQMDFMISDYSSVYLQFLLLDKPIGFAVPDFEEYLEKRGTVFEKPCDFMPGTFMQRREELYQFIADLDGGIDRYKEERKRVCDLIHQYKDGNNCKRLLEICNITL